MGNLAILVRIEVAAGRDAELLDLFDEWFAQFHRETGTEVYVLNRDGDEPNVFWCYEVYRDEDALQAHLASDVLARTLPRYRPLVTSQEVVRLEPIQAKGLLSPTEPAR
jgi:quinol monooxygenase YgiN